mgnify:CR=1 FL=1
MVKKITDTSDEIDEDDVVVVSRSINENSHRKAHLEQASRHKALGLKSKDRAKRREHFYAAHLHLSVANSEFALTNAGLMMAAG